MYGMSLYKAVLPTTIKEPKIKASQTITKGDPVNFVDGYVDVHDAGEEVYGVAMETKTDSGSGTDRIKIRRCMPGDEYLIDNDNDSATFNTTGYREGYYFDSTGATGAMQIDTDSAGTTGTFFCVDASPDPSDTSIGVFEVAEVQGRKSQ